MKPPCPWEQILISNLRMCLHPERRFFFSFFFFISADRLLRPSTSSQFVEESFLGESSPISRALVIFMHSCVISCTMHALRNERIANREEEETIDKYDSREDNTLSLRDFCYFGNVVNASNSLARRH